MVRDAELYRDALSGAYCLEADGPFRVNYTKLLSRRQEVVDTLVGGVGHLMTSHGIETIVGHGRIVDRSTVEVLGTEGTRRLSARAIIIASGSVPTPLAIPGSQLTGVITSNELLALESLPDSLVVIGGSVVGVEFACIFHALGTAVSIVGRKSFLRDADQQLAKRLKSTLSRRGISITIGVDFESITEAGQNTLSVNYVQRGKPKSAEGELVLLATGRSPYTDGLGLESVGVRMDGPRISVDGYLQTDVPGIYAIGDSIGGYMLAHVASYEGEVAVDNIMGNRRAVDYRVVPSCVFTMPEIADVGLTESQAKEAGIEYNATRFPFSVSGRALALGEPDGQLRMICERDPNGRSGNVLGVHIMGPHASDLIAEAALAMRLGATADDIASTIHAHPTVPEALMEVAMAHGHGAIHFDNR